MEYKNFIDNLSQNNANYSNPEQAITTANLCDTISRDINTDSQRFIYELLQNADDASNQSGILDVRVDFIADFVVFSHKGEPFSETDIESISSAGDGTKTEDSNKTGFKGIGFKSVFSLSNFVIIKSGNFCFKFDKHNWANYWNNTWGSQSAWKAGRKAKNKDESLKMPWQIIPIWTELPVEIKSLSTFQEYSVSTIIRYAKVEQLQKDLKDLFSESQIVLFLRSKQVKVSINTSEKIILEKSLSEDVATLKRNGNTLSEWLIKTEQFSIPSDVQTEINADYISPKKLKEAKQTEISFAIQVENGNLKAVEKENRLIFTYLPTSINYDFPFLVNANFITDAGRQHLHQDTYWNNWLFKQIPIKFFSWVAQLAHKNSKYKNQILTIVPHKLGNSFLENSFNEGFKIAIQTIPFIPNLKGDLLKVVDSIFDKTNISQFINPQTLINYINKARIKNFSLSSFTTYLEPISTLGKLGAEIFDIDDLGDFLASPIFTKEHKLNENFNLISFLHEQAKQVKGEENRIAWNEILTNTPFIYDENEQLKTPEEIYFPSKKFSYDYINKISIINKRLVSEIEANVSLKEWLQKLGVKEPTDLSFIEKTIIKDGDTFVTKENAIEIGRYLFNAHKKGIMKEQHYEGLNNFRLLTNNYSLINTNNAYLANFYEPELRLEEVYNNDIYVSENYFESKDLKSEWKTFFIKIGVNQNIGLQKIKSERRDNIVEKEYFNEVCSEAKKKAITQNYHPDFVGKYNHVTFDKITYSELADNYAFSLLFWNEVFKSILPYEISKDAYLHWGFYGSRWPVKNYLFWSLENLNIFPTTQKTCLKASQVYSNTIPQIFEVAGKYLPVFDYEGAIPLEWQTYLKFLPSLGLNEYLQILSSIWKENTQDEQLQKENQNRIGLIYEKLALLNFHTSEREIIKEWAISNKLLAKNGIDFFHPKDLSIVIVDGFRASHLAFVEKISPEIIELLRIFGVKIVDTIKAIISNSKIEISDLKNKLNQIAPLIALVAIEKSKDRKEWESEYERIIKKLAAINFFETDEICLSYGDENDNQQCSTWADNNNFYYVGKWYSPRVLDGLVEPLGKFLKIRYVERILTVLLLETFADGLEYLSERGFDISLIPDEFLNPNEPDIRIPNEANRPYNQSDEDLGRQGELQVYKELKNIYKKKYDHPLEETSTGFRIGDHVEVFWRNIMANTTANHDFKVVESNKEIYIDSKATSYGKNIEKLALYISGNELNLMEYADKYLIARVYNATGKNASVEFVRLQIDIL